MKRSVRFVPALVVPPRAEAHTQAHGPGAPGRRTELRRQAGRQHNVSRRRVHG
jgi:hypothetical protein